MIKKEDLRIGNRVLTPDKCAVITVDRITEEGINKPVNNEHDIYSDLAHYAFESLVPIILTDDYLLNELGFVKLGKGFIRNDVYIEPAQEEETGILGYKFAWGYSDFITWFNEVHDFQNLYYSLTGEAL